MKKYFEDVTGFRWPPSRRDYRIIRTMSQEERAEAFKTPQHEGYTAKQYVYMNQRRDYWNGGFFSDPPLTPEEEAFVDRIQSEAEAQAGLTGADDELLDNA